MPDYVQPEIAAVTGLVDTYLRWKDASEGPRGYERYHPSAFGNCLRLMQYQRYCERGYIQWPPEEKKPDVLRIFGTGHSMHERWRSYFDGLGVLKGYWTCENPMCWAYENNGYIHQELLQKYQMGEWRKKPRVYGKDQLQGCFKPDRCVCGSTHFHYDEIDVYSKELNFYGHCDMIIDFSKFDPKKLLGVNQSYLPEYLPSKPVVIDMKTINMYSFSELQDGKSEHKEYLIQLTIYANLLDCDYGILIYENKNNSKVHAVKVDKNSDIWFEKIKQQAILMNQMVDVIDGEITRHLLPPPRPLKQDGDECTWCRFRTQCLSSGIWEDPDLNEKRKNFYGVLL